MGNRANSGKILFPDIGKYGTWAVPVTILGEFNGTIGSGNGNGNSNNGNNGTPTDVTTVVNKLQEFEDIFKDRIPSGMSYQDGKLLVDIGDGNAFEISNDFSNPIPVSLVDLNGAATEALQNDMIAELTQIKELIIREPIITKEFSLSFRDDFNNSIFTSDNWNRRGSINSTSTGGGVYNFSFTNGNYYTTSADNEFYIETKFSFKSPCEILISYFLNKRTDKQDIFIEVADTNDRALGGWKLEGNDATKGTVFINHQNSSGLVKKSQVVDIGNAVNLIEGRVLGFTINKTHIDFFEGENIVNRNIVYTEYDEIFNQPTDGYKLRIRIKNKGESNPTLYLRLNYVSIQDILTPNFQSLNYSNVLEEIKTLLTPIYYDPIVKVIENTTFTIPQGAKGISLNNTGDESAFINDVEIFPFLSLSWNALGLDVLSDLTVDATNTKVIITYMETSTPRTARFLTANGDGYIIQE